MPLGWGILGAGIHTQRRMAAAFQRAPGSRIAAVCDSNVELARSLAAAHQVEKVYDSLDKMLKDPDVGAVYISTPNNLHADHTVKAAAAGKHILCEKPMALTEAECTRMIEACDKYPVKLAVNFQNRYHPAHIEARRLIQSGEIGDIAVVRAQYCHGLTRGSWPGWRSDPNVAGAGALMGTGLHPIDLLRFALNSEIDEITAVCDPPPASGAVDDMVYAVLKFANGVHGVIVTGILAPRSDNDVVFYGSKARITCKGTVGMPLLGELVVEGDNLDVKMKFPTKEPVSENYVRLIGAFLRCIETGAEPDSPGRNGRQMVRIANAIIESSLKGQKVKIEGGN